MFEIGRKHNWHLNIYLSGKKILHRIHFFDFRNLSIRNEKLKKEKRQCSQNHDLNPTYDKVSHCSVLAKFITLVVSEF